MNPHRLCRSAWKDARAAEKTAKCFLSLSRSQQVILPQTEIHMYTSNPGPPHKQNYDQGGSPQVELRPGRLPTSKITTREPYPQAELRPGTWLAGWLAELRPGNLSSAWLAGWLVGWLAGGLKPREAQRGPERPREAAAWIEQACHAVGWTLPTSRFTSREVLHRFLYIWNPRGSPRGLCTTDTYLGVPNRTPLETQGLPTSRITTREAPHKQDYDQGGSPQAEFRPGSLPKSAVVSFGQGLLPCYVHTHRAARDGKS